MITYAFISTTYTHHIPQKCIIYTTLSVVNNSKNISAVTLLFQEYKDVIANETILPSDIDIQLDTILKKGALDLQNDMNGVSDVIDNNSSIKYLMRQCFDLLNQVNRSTDS